MVRALSLDGGVWPVQCHDATPPRDVIEGSDDGEHWIPYELRYKPGDPRRPARWAAPHQPRVDWQMWFAPYEAPPAWFVRLLVRLLEGAPDVERFFAKTPFPDHPPRYIRAELYEYGMTDRATRNQTGELWKRRRVGRYMAPLKLSAPASLPESVA